MARMTEKHPAETERAKGEAGDEPVTPRLKWWQDAQLVWCIVLMISGIAITAVLSALNAGNPWLFWVLLVVVAASAARFVMRIIILRGHGITQMSLTGVSIGIMFAVVALQQLIAIL